MGRDDAASEIPINVPSCFFLGNEATETACPSFMSPGNAYYGTRGTSAVQVWETEPPVGQVMNCVVKHQWSMSETSEVYMKN